jgi:inner membrane protein
MITGVSRERLQRRNEAVADITSSWGKEQNLIGPVLGTPYQTVKEVPAPDGKVERREVEETATANAYFLPETLNVSGNVETQKLHRGIYDAVVYRAQTVLSGKFVPPDFGPLKIDLKDVQWKDTFVTIAINDLRGTRQAIVLDDIQFSIPLDFSGSEGIFFAPFGVQNEATLKSNSPDVGFRGAFLPAERSLRADGAFTVVGESCLMLPIRDSPRPSHKATPKGFAGIRLRSECHAILHCNPTVPQRYEVRPRKDHRGVDLISDALPFGRLW